MTWLKLLWTECGRFEDFGWLGGCLEGLESVWSLENKGFGLERILFNIRHLRGFWLQAVEGLECGQLGGCWWCFREILKNKLGFIRGNVRTVRRMSSASVEDWEGAESHLDFVKSYFSDPEMVLLVISFDAFENISNRPTTKIPNSSVHIRCDYSSE